MKTLEDIKEGEAVKVRCLHCGHGIKHRLCSLGLYNDQKVKIIKNDNIGPIIVEVMGSKVVLGRGQARKIRVICRI